MMGEKETAREVAVQNIKAMDPADYDYVLTLCASCGSHLKENYPKLLSEEPALAVKVSQLRDKADRFQLIYDKSAESGSRGIPAGPGARWPITLRVTCAAVRE